MARHLLLFLTLVFWKTSNADPHSKEVIRAMDKIISKHISWNDWDEWNALMQKVSKIQIFKNTYLSISTQTLFIFLIDVYSFSWQI